MKLVEIQGLTGLIKFDQWGIRNEFVLDLVELRRGGLEKVGWWQESYGIRSGFVLKNKMNVTLIFLSFNPRTFITPAKI